MIILLTDGSNNQGDIAPITAAEIAKTFGIRVYAIGVGSHGTINMPVQTPFGVRYQQVESEFDMKCGIEEGKTADEVTFTRSGVNGTLHVTADKFELRAKLGFLLGAFKGRIEAEIVKNLDDLLAPKAGKAAAKPAAKPAAKKK